jgi:Cu/Ag efflux pump CusA
MKQKQTGAAMLAVMVVLLAVVWPGSGHMWMIGGMVTATILSLLVMPVIYGWVLLIQEKYRKV